MINTAEDLIYNRFDIIHPDKMEIEKYKYKNEEFIFRTYKENEKICLNIWGKRFPEDVIENVINDVFIHNPEVLKMEITRAYNNYKNLLYETNDILLELPDSFDKLLLKIKAKHRYNLRRSGELMEKKLGIICVKNYAKQDIPQEYVELFFEWKEKTHGTNYHLTAQEYLDKYYVTDCIVVTAGEKPVSILFYCKVNETVYLENLSYDIEEKQFSPGFIGYVNMLQELIQKKCKVLYLGGGGYSYKKYFGTIENTAYSGNIYSNRFYQLLNKWMKENHFSKYALYGLGAIAKCFLKEKDKIDAKLCYGIDQNERIIPELTTLTKEDMLPQVDVVFVTLKHRDCAIENFLNSRFAHVYYWSDMSSLLYNERWG